jgi:hypothetical protein
MVQVGNPQVGMIWTCLRDVKTPVNGIVSLQDQKIWEFGNTTSAAQDPEANFWRLVPVLRNQEQANIHSHFPSDSALGKCKMEVNDPIAATTAAQYGIKYITVTSMLADSSTAAPIVATSVSVYPLPLLTHLSSTPTPQASSSDAIQVATSQLSSSLGVNNRTETGGVNVVRTEHKVTATTIQGPAKSDYPNVSTQLVTPALVVPGSPVSTALSMVKPAQSMAKAPSSGATKGSDPKETSGSRVVTKSRPIVVNNQILKPTGENQYTTQDGQVLILNGPAITLRSSPEAKKGSQVALVSGPQGANMLMIDGDEEPLRYASTPFLDGANFGDMLLPWDYEDFDYYGNGESPPKPASTKGMTGSKKPQPATYQGSSTSHHITSIQISLLALGILFCI